VEWAVPVESTEVDIRSDAPVAGHEPMRETGRDPTDHRAERTGCVERRVGEQHRRERDVVRRLGANGRGPVDDRHLAVVVDKQVERVKVAVTDHRDAFVWAAIGERPDGIGEVGPVEHRGSGLEVFEELVDLIWSSSRFGIMFFSDANAAFANIANALVSEGRLCLATWQPLIANEWLAVPGAALLPHAELPATDPAGPGMFAQSDPAVVSAILSAAGFGDIRIDAAEVTFTIGRTIDEAVEYLADSGPGRALLETIAEGPTREAALSDVRDGLADHHEQSGVRLGGGIWLISATR